jgi:hypothetical protein
VFTDFRYWCHFDDDQTNLNLTRVLNMLNQFDCTKKWYLGNLSVHKAKAVQIQNVSFSLSYIVFSTVLSRGVRARELFRRKDFSKKSKVMLFYFGVRALK